MDTAAHSEQKAALQTDFPHRRWKDHPRPGVDFPDAATFTCDAGRMRAACDALSAHLHEDSDILAGIDIGGLGFAGALAIQNGLGFIDIRKVDAIRADVVRSLAANYELGNGIALSKGHQLAGRHITIIDDCLMSGATALATAQLLRRLGARCTQALFVFELEGLGGRERLVQGGLTVHTLQKLPPAQPE